MRTGREQQQADPIAMHPAVQRLLMTQRATIEAGRMLGYWTALRVDIAGHHPDQETRLKAQDHVALVTPLIKAMFTEQAFQCSSLALQVFGGHGHICESDIEQYMRDVRVMMLYEGSNEIQAIDLMMRKVLNDDGVLASFLLLIENDTQCAQKESCNRCLLLLALDRNRYVRSRTRCTDDQCLNSATQLNSQDDLARILEAMFLVDARFTGLTIASGTGS